ncbi:MAG TPA: heme biosynthesis HemY N-terminal domain-containing protein [Methylophilaceae bacterium]|nr:heme biosynthesis HemY N-terminal domain-containing protein [Methylophilaceae bacterium]
MRWLFWLLFILALAIGVTLLAGNNEGYVLIVRPPYRLELSLNLLLILVVVSFAALHIALRVFHYMRRLPASVRAYKKAQRLKKGHGALLQSLHALVEGRYQVAEKAAARALALGEDAGLSALVAARAAHKLKRKPQRDNYLAEAERLAPQASTARLLSQAELLLDDRQYNEALNVLRQLEKRESKYAPALRLELKIQLRLNNWEQVLALLQQLEKMQEIEPWQADEIRQQAHQHMIVRFADDLSALGAYWKSLPQQDRLHSRLAYLAAQSFIALGAENQAVAIIEKSLLKKWDSELASLLGDCISDNPQKQLQQAEAWLHQHEGDADLLLALGSMCVRLQLWGKAQSYLEASLSVRPSAQAHLLLANMFDSRGDSEAAAREYRLSAQLFKQAAKSR